MLTLYPFNTYYSNLLFITFLLNILLGIAGCGDAASRSSTRNKTIKIQSTLVFADTTQVAMDKVTLTIRNQKNKATIEDDGSFSLQARADQKNVVFVVNIPGRKKPYEVNERLITENVIRGVLRLPPVVVGEIKQVTSNTTQDTINSATDTTQNNTNTDSTQQNNNNGQVQANSAKLQRLADLMERFKNNDQEPMREVLRELGVISSNNTLVNIYTKDKAFIDQMPLSDFLQLLVLGVEYQQKFKVTEANKKIITIQLPQ